MKSLFEDQFRYNQWANEKLLAFIVENKLTSNRINPILSHLTLAQVIWCDRLQNKPTPQAINEWATWPWEEIESKCLTSSKALISYVENHIDNHFDEEINFLNTSGMPYTRAAQQVLTHVAQYTNFHRGQVVGLVHQNENLMTPSFDYIDFVNS